MTWLLPGMINPFSSVPKPLVYLGVIIAVVAAIWLYGRAEYRSGRSDGIAYMEKLNAEADAKQSKEREKINDQVEKLDDRGLCLALGGGLQCDR